jgi:curved DNA-binding protein CbpA
MQYAFVFILYAGGNMENIRQSYYDLIGVRPDASQDEIEKACLSLGELYRPDRNSGDAYCAERFAAVERAYLALSNPVTREAHDRRFGLVAESPTMVTAGSQCHPAQRAGLAAGVIKRSMRALWYAV